jgi:hypothetical protein
MTATRGRLGAALLGLAAAGLAGSQVATGQTATPRATVTAVFTSQTPDTSTGRTEFGDFVDPANPEGKPHAAQRVVLKLAEGARFNTVAIPRCTANDAALMASGPTACPEDTRVGQGPVVVDSGVDGPTRLVTVEFTAFNAQNALILVGKLSEDGGYIVIRGVITDNTLTIDFPPIPGSPPEGGALKSERIVFSERSDQATGAAYLTTPPTCPASGQWVNTLTYTYRDGVTETVTSASPCQQKSGNGGPKAKLRIDVRGLPKGCARRDFTARVRVRGAASLRRLRVSIDHHRVAWTTKRSVARRVDVQGLRRKRGRHLVKVYAASRDGRTARKRVYFRTC